MWSLIDDLAHLAYCPTMRGRRCARACWHHRIHPIPGRLLDGVCRRYERAEGMRPSA